MNDVKVSSVKLTTDAIARAGLTLLNDVGLDGLTMRNLAAALDVRAPALYWHVRNKQELLDQMARLLYLEAVDGLESPRRATDWTDWIADLARRLRRSMLRYRDGARVYAGTHVEAAALFRTMELTLATLTDAGFGTTEAARAMTTILHFTVGFTIEEQARQGTAYRENPYVGPLAVDASRYPLTAAAVPAIFGADPDEEFDAGLLLIIAGLRAQVS